MENSKPAPSGETRLHIQDYSCNDGGTRDYGSLPYNEAFAKVKELMDGGNNGGCRCRPGWTIRSCPKAQHDCSEFNLDKYKYDDIYAD